MCGIAGILNNDIQRNEIQDTVINMLSSIQHRGPDESGIYIDENVCIGNVRLSIIDLLTGQQPMGNDNGNLWIVFNGEIFNYLELKKELSNLGHKFKTTSDTEVLLHAYEAYGANCLSKLNGQFVFAIWDNYTQELFIARDRLGIRPLFYTQTNNKFIFGSEIKTILQNKEVHPQLNNNVLSQIFTFWTCIPGKTPFNNIFELQPGHYIKVKKGEVLIKKYWELVFAEPEEYLNSSFDVAKEEFMSILTDSISLRLRSDVPVAAYLSGGLDSSIITSLIKQISPQHLNTFSIGFSDHNFDETKFQEEVSNYLNTSHTSYKCTPSEIAEVFPKVIWHSEVPMFRTAPAPMFLLSKMVRENNIKVVMTGEGADEIMAGYDVFKEAQIREFWSRVPNSRIRPILLRKLYPYIPQISTMNTQALKFVFGYKLNDTANPFYAFLLRWNNGNFIRKYFSTDLKAHLINYNPITEFEPFLPDKFKNWEILSKSQWVESKLLLSNYLLSTQGDRMGMANSIEGRYPFLDYRLVEFAAKLPPTYKMRGLNEKYLLKKAMKGKLPESVLKRGKQAYRAPISSVFFADKAPDYVAHYLSKEKINAYNIFNYSIVEQLVNKIKYDKNISENETMIFTGILSTQMFYSMFIENDSTFNFNRQRLTPVIISKFNKK